MAVHPLAPVPARALPTAVLVLLISLLALVGGTGPCLRADPVAAAVAGPHSSAPGMARNDSDPAGDAARYHPPVEAPVVDPFRPPANQYGPGNRGIDYATVPGTPIVACGPGVVVFAGPVAGQLYVTIRHGDGIRTTYSYLAWIAVRTGDQVTGATVVGRSGARFQVGARQGDTYIDPASLWGRAVGPSHPILVADDGFGPPSSPADPMSGPDPGGSGTGSIGATPERSRPPVGAASFDRVGHRVAGVGRLLAAALGEPGPGHGRPR
ncbi:MAG TPA: M23 family metallopeptidase [Acidimicrobiales bacterium]